MKFGYRKPSFKKRISAKTSFKRKARHSLGLKAPKGTGIFTNPQKAIYNKVYNHSTYDPLQTKSGESRFNSYVHTDTSTNLVGCALLCVLIIAVIFFFIGLVLSFTGIGAIIGVPLMLASVAAPFGFASGLLEGTNLEDCNEDYEVNYYSHQNTGHLIQHKV